MKYTLVVFDEVWFQQQVISSIRSFFLMKRFIVAIMDHKDILLLLLL